MTKYILKGLFYFLLVVVGGVVIVALQPFLIVSVFVLVPALRKVNLNEVINKK